MDKSEYDKILYSSWIRDVICILIILIKRPFSNLLQKNLDDSLNK